MLIWWGCGAPERLSPEWRTILAGDWTDVFLDLWCDWREVAAAGASHLSKSGA